MKFLIPKLSRGSLTVIALSLVAMAGFAIFTALAGGDALTGEMKDGRFYLGDRLKQRQVSRSTYVTSAALCLLACIGGFVLGHEALEALKSVGILEQRQGLALVLNLFFALGCGSVAVFAAITLLRAVAR